MPDPDPSFLHSKVLLKNGYDLVKLLGSGEMGYVFLCKNSQGEMLAVKVSLVSEKSRHELQMHSIVTEHPNVVSLHCNFITATHQYLVMDYLPGGNLLALVSKKGALPLPRARRYFYQLISGLNYCHNLGVVHRDVKLENILLDESCENIYLTDWDLSGNWTPTGRLNKFCGSPHYAAPEVFKGIPYIGPELDVWSAGVVLFSIVCGRFPFNGASTIDIAYRVQKGELNFPVHITDASLINLIRALLTVDPNHRISMDSVLAHPFLLSDEQLTQNLRCSSQTGRISFADSSSSSTMTPDKAGGTAATGKKRSNSVIYSKNVVSPASTDESVSASDSSNPTIGVSTARSRIFESRHKIHSSSRGRSGTGDEEAAQSSAEAPPASTIQTRHRSQSIDVTSRHKLTSSAGPSSSRSSTGSHRQSARPSASDSVHSGKGIAPPPTKSLTNLRNRERRMTFDSTSSPLSSSAGPSSSSSVTTGEGADGSRKSSKFAFLKPRTWFKKK